MSAARFHNGRFKVQPGLTLRRLDGGAVELVFWNVDGTHGEPIVIHAQDWTDGITAVTPDAETLPPADWLLRATFALQLHNGRVAARKDPDEAE